MKDEKQYLDEVKSWRNFKTFTFLDWTRQYCNHAFLSLSFRGKSLTWRELPKEEIYWQITLGPRYFPTDFGACCMLIPHLYFERRNSNISLKEWWFDVEADSLNGEANGLEVILDAEQFNYAYHKANSAGFRQGVF